MTFGAYLFTCDEVCSTWSWMYVIQVETTLCYRWRIANVINRGLFNAHSITRTSRYHAIQSDIHLLIKLLNFKYVNSRITSLACPNIQNDEMARILGFITYTKIEIQFSSLFAKWPAIGRFILEITSPIDSMTTISGSNWTGNRISDEECSRPHYHFESMSRRIKAR
jgi:hypothetical protein